MPAPAPGHRWQFFRVGGVDQVALRDRDDLRHLADLDRKLWVALAAPVRGLEIEPRTLELIDGDKDGRIRVPEVLEAVRWMGETLHDLNDVVAGGDSVPLASIKSAPIAAGARRILDNLGRGDATTITLADVSDTRRIFAGTRFNGDGVVPPESAEDAATRAVIEDVIATHGSVPDRSGVPGIDRDKAKAFFAELRALVEWDRQGASRADLAPARALGAVDAVKAVRAKVDDYFTRCHLAALDGRAGSGWSGVDADWLALSGKDLGAGSAELARFPLARVAMGPAPLALDGPINPAWRAPVAAFGQHAVKPLLGRADEAAATLTEEEWATLQARLAPWEAWVAAKPVTAVEKLGLERLRAIAASGAEAAVGALLDQDAALAEENAQIESVEKLIRLRRDLFKLLNNFVNFSDFYGRKGAIFQVGTLYLDGRSCRLCVEVGDPARHGLLAAMSSAYLAYCDCTRPGGEKMSIAAAVTDGDADNLMVGRNGVFFDRRGRDWDATVTRIVANPISVREAFWSPYKKLVRLIEEQIGKRAAAGESEAHGKLAEAAAATVHADKAKAPPAEKRLDVGTVAAIGVAIGGIGAMVTGLLGSFLSLGFWMPLGVLALLVLISGPSVVLAWLKLRQRNLGPLLDANGWAINGRARINVPFGRALTDVAALPPGAARSLVDPFAEKKRRWGLWLLLAMLVAVGACWFFGKLDRFLPAEARSDRILHRAPKQ